VKAEDGTARAAQVAVGHILQELGVFDAEERRALEERLIPPVANRAGLEVGRIRPAPGSGAAASGAPF
jgi:L-asparaginase II